MQPHSFMSSSDDKQRKRKIADDEEKEWDDERAVSVQADAQSRTILFCCFDVNNCVDVNHGGLYFHQPRHYTVP